MRFVKMHGIGNDYVYINCFEKRVDDPAALARRVSDRHTGVGSDGLVLILPSTSADVRMRMFNSDGSEAEMCGNAIRCVGKLAYERGLVRGTDITVDTLAGLRRLTLHTCSGDPRMVDTVTVDMGEPEWRPERIPVRLPECVAGRGAGGDFVALPVDVGGMTYTVTCVSMGNPHAVIFTTGVDALELPRLGPLFEHHALFPQRINTEFVEVRDAQTLYMRVWERGAGETMACGTGACAVAVAAARNGLTGRAVTVRLRGGDLHIVWREDDGHVYMTGAATAVFEGTLL